jgi:hypothetical protein
VFNNAPRERIDGTHRPMNSPVCLSMRNQEQTEPRKERKAAINQSITGKFICGISTLLLGVSDHSGSLQATTHRP